MGLVLAVSAQMSCGDAGQNSSEDVVQDIKATSSTTRASSSTTTQAEREITTTTATVTTTTSPPDTTTTSPPTTTAPPPPGLTLAQYEQLYVGMPEGDVWAIITTPCRLEAESQTPAFEFNGEVVVEALHGKHYTCEASSGILSIGIQNGQVSFLSQYGLR